MDGIRVVADLVQCAADLLVCTHFDTDQLRFVDVEACRRKLPTLIREFESMSTTGDVVMGRCRFQLDRMPAAAVYRAQRAERITGSDNTNVSGSFEPSAP
jgi:hypothetical protein